MLYVINTAVTLIKTAALYSQPKPTRFANCNRFCMRQFTQQSTPYMLIILFVSTDSLDISTVFFFSCFFFSSWKWRPDFSHTLWKERCTDSCKVLHFNFFVHLMTSQFFLPFFKSYYGTSHLPIPHCVQYSQASVTLHLCNATWIPVKLL